MKRLVINGGAGRMGQAMAQAFSQIADFAVVALVDVHEPANLFGAAYYSSLDALEPDTVDVVIDFSNPNGVVSSATWCASHAKGLVIGTTGLSADQRSAVTGAASSTGVVMASNFSLGAVLADRFAAMAAPYFDRVEIIELHHDKKVDAPSGTSQSTAQAITASLQKAGKAVLPDPTEKFSIEGARGADAGSGIKIHSVRLPGLVAHQEILFGGPGEGLTIRHDSYDRQSFVQGVAIAARFVSSVPGLVEGIDSLLD